MTSDSVTAWREGGRGGGVPFELGPALLATCLVGYGVSLECGMYSEPALLFVMAGVSILVWRYAAAALRPASLLGTIAPEWVTGFLWIGLFFSLWCGWNDAAPIWYAGRVWTFGHKLQVLEMGLLVTYLPAMVARWREPRWLRLARFALFAALLVDGAIGVIRASPHPSIDVWTMQTKAAEALAQGQNPYSSVTVGNTAPGSVRGTPVPLVYPPTQIFAAYLGNVLGHDVRFAMSAALLATGLALRWLTRRRPGSEPLPPLVEDAPALFLWFTPKIHFIVEQAWTDPVSLALIALTVVAYVARRPFATAVIFGLALSSKQTMFWLLPLGIFVLRLRPKEWLLAGAVALASAIPFMFNFAAFKHGVIDFNALLPPRDDGLTITTFVVKRFGVHPPATLIALVLALIVVGVASWRLRGAAAFALTLACTYAVFFAFNKWAFANYYFLVLGLSALAAAASFHPATTGAQVPRDRTADP